MLRDLYYVGCIVYKGEVYAGRHEPIVDQELFDRVQEVLDFRSKNGQRDRVLQHYLKGTLFCDRCERHERTSRLIYTEAINRSGTRYGYFLCRGRQDGVCDLPYLPVDSVERAIADHYATLNLPGTFITEVRRLLDEALAGEQRSVAELHAALSRKLKELEAKEDRLLDLLADDALPKTKVKAKLRKIQSERNAAEASLAGTGAELAIGAGVLSEALDLMSNPEASYADGSDAIRRNINETFYQRFYLDEQGVQASDLNPPFEDFRAALTMTRRTPTAASASTKQGPLTGASDRAGHSSTDLALTLTDILLGTGSSKTSLVELRGLEPLTPTLPVWCATSCAIAPRRRAHRSYTTDNRRSKLLLRPAPRPPATAQDPAPRRSPPGFPATAPSRGPRSAAPSR